jgi:hypothetical protein
MSRPRRRLIWAIPALALVLSLWAFSGCTSILGDFEIGSGSGSEAGSGKAVGQPCGAPNECATSFCTDGVCCETACNGVCEACNLPTVAGKCMPVPDGQDPANECPTQPLPDAGAVIVIEEDGGEVDASADAGASFAQPDGGVTTDDNQCAGKCNGKRACGFPGAERTCGDVFCGNKAEQGRAACDGVGHCVVGAEKCEAFSCPDGSPGCKKTCTAETDCLATHFCEAASSSCKPKLGNGSACSSPATCQSGFCIDGVCCNSECTPGTAGPGATCTQPGSVGSCRCSSCPTGPCRLYYRDEDEDGFGDKYGVIGPAFGNPGGNGRAIPGCEAGPAPVGYVANKQDCLDGPKTTPYTSVRPNQTAYFPGSYAVPPAGGGGTSFDYNCDGDIDPETPTFLNGTCGFCTPFLKGCIKTTSCSTKGQAAGLACRLQLCPIRGCTTPSCSTDTRTGFTTVVACGASAAATNCGVCVNGTLGPSQTPPPQIQQRCR